MAAVANATGLVPQAQGLAFPALRHRRAGRAAAAACRRRATRRTGHARGRVEPAPRRLAGAGRPALGRLRDYRGRRPSRRGRVRGYGLATSRDGRVAALWRPAHLVGLELGVSIARAAIAGEPTGVARAPIAEVACRAKRDLAAGEIVDGEGGEHVYGVLRARTAHSDALPMGLARGARILRPIARGLELARADVELVPGGAAERLHAELAAEVATGAAHT